MSFQRPFLLALSTALLSLSSSTGCRTGRDWEPDGQGREYRDQQEEKDELELDNGTFTVRARGVDRTAFDQVVHAIRSASRELRRWGDFREPVAIRIFPDVERFDEAVGEGRFPNRRGFARYDQVFLLSPSTWSSRGAREAELEELVLHELTHSLMYQHASTRTGWRRKGIPFWFREGMASYTARQAYRWKEPSRAEIRGRSSYQDEEDDSPFPHSERDDVQSRYGVAHYAFDALLARGGERRIRELLDEMEEGSDFEEAFEETYRKPVLEFIAELERGLPEER